jgi:hypothetical protein
MLASKCDTTKKTAMIQSDKTISNIFETASFIIKDIEAVASYPAFEEAHILAGPPVIVRMIIDNGIGEMTDMTTDGI